MIEAEWLALRLKQTAQYPNWVMPWLAATLQSSIVWAEDAGPYQKRIYIPYERADKNDTGSMIISKSMGPVRKGVQELLG